MGAASNSEGRKRLAEQKAMLADLSADFAADPTPHTDPTRAAVRAAQAEALHPITPAEQRPLRDAFERDQWADEWNSLPTAIDRMLELRADRLATDTAAPERECPKCWGDGYIDHDLGREICETCATPAAPVAVEGVETVETLAEVTCPQCPHGIKWHHDERGCDYLGPTRDKGCPCALSIDAAVTARIVQARAGEGALREVRRAIGELLRTLDEGRYRFEETHVRADLNYLRALTRAAALDPEATT